MTSALVSTAWLHDHLQSPDVRIVDATYCLPHLGRNPKAEFEDAHIPGAVFFDIDDVADDKNPLPHMVPSAAKFAARVRRMGLGDGSRIVVYDSNRFCASARVWWMFRLFGHPDVTVLDGGLAKWQAEGRPLDDFARVPTERHFTARQNTLLLRELDQMRRNLTGKAEQVVDARSAGRFAGVEPEPREGLRPGHIPGSRNLPFDRLIDPQTHTLLEKEALAQAFAEAGVDIHQPIATTCGSGVSAAVLNLALYELGRGEVALYDGSWTEWGGQPDTPVAMA
ncbi:MAG: 3-mercaptopyruvate sulfurtransferase [Geminicoccaceae bacterium]|nr:MAG: 3-mercaptopyruvate sulfurtransferase [Geminicoccaceae bacterium]